jgi:hypothetical protein
MACQSNNNNFGVETKRPRIGDVHCVVFDPKFVGETPPEAQAKLQQVARIKDPLLLATELTGLSKWLQANEFPSPATLKMEH